jgi:glucokinase
VVVISVGTGLGEAAIIPLGQGALTVLPSEGGHKQFAPFDQHSSAILQQAFATGHGAISWENWFSGMGLPHLFQAIYPDMEAPGSNTITRLALAQPFSPSGECVRMFTRGLLAEAGNLALQHLAWGGVIFAGGVAQHLQGWLADKENQRFLALKSGHCERLQNIPLALCTDTQAALKGAAAFFKQQKSCGS